eukprot:TRINITY_DN1371_c0_g2_i2.p1 TRINITY_DN1371_c0_g2~~TRINITY_DN1371_c0_g2_i2.p1  ORF type:complete len:404 (+),score=78.63 TRINITY_DN1371_c0_g2_i2:73-1284(+)
MFTSNNFYWFVSDDLKTKYKNEFLTHARNGFLTGADAAEFFNQSGLSRNELAAIWDISDQDQDNKLSEVEFYIARFLTDARLNQQPIPTELPESFLKSVYAPTRKSKSLPVNFFQNHQTPRPLSPINNYVCLENESEEIFETLWSITKQNRKAYIKMFADINENGYVSGIVASEYFSRSGLDRNLLARIWTCSDLDRDHQLNGNEFLICSHFVHLSLQGYEIPDSVPLSMLNSLKDPKQGVCAEDSQYVNDIARGFTSIKKAAERLKENDTLPNVSTPGVVQLQSDDIFREECIGGGTSGKVWKGQLHGNVVAVKDMTSIQAAEIELWKKEVELLGYLRDQVTHLVNIFGFSVSRGCLTIVMEYMDLGSLYDLIHKDNEMQWSMLHKVVSYFYNKILYYRCVY